MQLMWVKPAVWVQQPLDWQKPSHFPSPWGMRKRIPVPCENTPEKESMSQEPHCGKTTNTIKVKPLACNLEINTAEGNYNATWTKSYGVCSERSIRSTGSWPTKYIATDLHHEKQSKNILYSYYLKLRPIIFWKCKYSTWLNQDNHR